MNLNTLLHSVLGLSLLCARERLLVKRVNLNSMELIKRKGKMHTRIYEWWLFYCDYVGKLFVNHGQFHLHSFVRQS